MARVRVSVILLVLLCTALPTFAINRSWTGSTSANWSEPSNWSPSGVPDPSDTLVFPAGASNRSMTNDLAAGTSFGPMTFNDSYTLNGNALTLTGNLNFLWSVVFTCNADLKLANAVTFGSAITSAYKGAINVNGQTLTINPYNTTVSGAVSGSGTINIVSSGGGLELTGSGTFSGAIDGDIDLNGSYPNATISGGRLTGVATLGAVNISAFRMMAPGVWPPAGSADSHGIGTLQTGPLTLSGDYWVDLVPGGTSDQTKVTGTVSLGGGSLQVSIPSGAPAVGQTFTIIDNDGTDAVSGTFAGLPEGATFQVGTTTFAISYHGGDGNDVVLTVASSQKSWTGAVSGNWSNPQNWSPQSIPAGGEALLFPAGASNRTMTNDLAAGTSVGPMTFNDSYTLSGNALTLTGNLNFLWSVVFTCYADLKLATSVTFGAAITSTYKGAINVNGQTLTINPYNTTVSGPVSGSGTIEIVGNPAGLELASSGTFSGTIDGDVDLNGSYPNATIHGGRLTGVATVGSVTIAAFQLMAAGTWYGGTSDSHAIGTLQTGPLTLGGDYWVDLVPGGTSDQTKVTGTVSLCGGNLHVTIVSGAPTVGQTFTIIDNDGTDAVSGTFAGLPEGATFQVGTTTFAISYHGGDGNDVVLTVASSLKSWTGAVSGNWSNPQNWSPPSIPAAGEALLFPAGASNRTMTNDLAAGTSFGPMTFNDSYTLNGNALTLTGNLNFAFGTGKVFTCYADLKLATSVTFGEAITSDYRGAIDVNGQTLTLDTYNTSVHGPVSGSGTIAIVGNPAGLELASSGTFSGTIDGDVDLNGSYPNATIDGGRLTGVATVGSVNIGAFQLMAAGTWYGGTSDSHAIGTLQTGPLTLGGDYWVDLVPGGTSDQTKVTGTVSLGGGNLHVTIVSGAPTVGQTFTIIDNDGTDPVNGTFAGLPEAATLNVGVYTFRISYHGGDGNDVVLTTAGESSTTLAQSKATTEFGEPFTLTATVTSPFGVPTGSVTFFDGSVSLGSVVLNSGAAAMTLSRLTPGTHTFTAVYDGEGQFLGSASAPLSHDVKKGHATVSLASSGTLVYGNSITFTVGAQPVAPAPADIAPTGSITVSADGVPIATVPLVNGAGTYAASLLPAGTHAITASWGGDANYESADATPASLTVAKAPTVITIPSGAPTAAGDSVVFTVAVTGNGIPADGTIAVAEGGNALASQPLSAGNAVVSIAHLPAGDHVLSVAYPGSANFEPSSATVRRTVLLPLVSADALRVPEGDQGVHTVTMTVRLSAPSPDPVQLSYATADGTAKENRDYLPARGTLTFNPGQTTQSIDLQIVGNTTPEQDKTFSVVLSEVTNATLATSSVDVVIVNDDPFYDTYLALEYAPSLTLDLYVPKNGGPFPLVVWIPGDLTLDGAISRNTPALHEAQRGYAVAALTYRPSLSIDGPLADVQTALRWLRANAARFHLDPQRFAAWGAGAGAQIAGLTGTIDVQAASLATFSSKVEAVVDSAGPTDAVLPYVGPAAAPFLILQGEDDDVVPPADSEKLYDALRTAGVNASLSMIANATHDPALWSTTGVLTQVDAFLDRTLKGGRHRPSTAR